MSFILDLKIHYSKFLSHFQFLLVFMINFMIVETSALYTKSNLTERHKRGQAVNGEMSVIRQGYSKAIATDIA